MATIADSTSRPGQPRPNQIKSDHIISMRPRLSRSQITLISKDTGLRSGDRSVAQANPYQTGKGKSDWTRSQITPSSDQTGTGSNLSTGSTAAAHPLLAALPLKTPPKSQQQQQTDCPHPRPHHWWSWQDWHTPLPPNLLWRGGHLGSCCLQVAVCLAAAAGCS